MQIIMSPFGALIEQSVDNTPDLMVHNHITTIIKGQQWFQ